MGSQTAFALSWQVINWTRVHLFFDVPMHTIDRGFALQHAKMFRNRVQCSTKRSDYQYSNCSLWQGKSIRSYHFYFIISSDFIRNWACDTFYNLHRVNVPWAVMCVLFSDFEFRNKSIYSFIIFIGFSFIAPLRSVDRFFYENWSRTPVAIRHLPFLSVALMPRWCHFHFFTH